LESRQLAQDSLNDLTEAANALLLKGKIDVYQYTRSDIKKLLPEKQPPQSSSSTGGVVQWEYQGNEDAQIHGPFSTQQMLGWVQAGYFVGPSAVKVRTVKTASSEKSMGDDLLADLMEDTQDDKKEQLSTAQERGEWTISDKVDFANYQV
jgi:hypothetical protein